MEILVTGATGFIGQAVVRDALSKGHEVYAHTRSLEKARAIFGEQPNLHIIDNLDGQPCSKAIHLAWADVSNYMDDANFAENLAMQKGFVDALMDAGVTDLTVAGTCLEYGKTEGACREDMAVSELHTTYAEAKTALQEYLSGKDGLTLKWGRVFYVYGEGSRPNSLLSLLLKAIENGDEVFPMSKGDQQRDFMHISTLANNIVATCLQDEVSGIINWGNGTPRTVLEFVEAIMALKGHVIELDRTRYPYPDYEAFAFWADVEKLNRVKGVKYDDKIWL